MTCRTVSKATNLAKVQLQLVDGVLGGPCLGVVRFLKALQCNKRLLLLFNSGCLDGPRLLDGPLVVGFQALVHGCLLRCLVASLHQC